MEIAQRGIPFAWPVKVKIVRAHCSFVFRGLLATALTCTVTPCSTAATVATKKRVPRKVVTQSTSQDILASCASFALGFVPKERAFLMVRVATVAASHKFPQSEQWARQAFAISSDLPEGPNKLPLQKNSLIALAATHPMDALHLLGSLGAPKLPDKGPKLSEDVRADAAQIIFASAYRDAPQKALLPMTEVSSYFGRTGEYPYQAWGILLPKIAKDHPDTFDETFSTAVRFYVDGETRTRSQDEDYFRMVNAIRTVATHAQMNLAVSAGIDRLLAKKSTSDMTYFAVTGQGKQEAGFDDPTRDLLYRWLPLVKEFDTAEYDDLAKKLHATGTPPANAKHAVVEVLTKPSNMTPKLQEWAQDHLQAQIVVNDAASDPDRAIRESVTIHSEALRSDALALGAMNISTKAMPQRGKLLAESKRDLDQVHTKDADYLRAIADLADAYVKSKMGQSALSLIHDGLDEGSEILEESADEQPGTPTMLLNGYDSLAKLVQIGMKLDPTSTLKYVRNLRNMPLQVNLLVDIADALATQQVA